MVKKVDTTPLSNPKTLRLLDANINRACEGLRVVEDTARFLWDDMALYNHLRSLRHKIHGVTKTHYQSLVQARESQSDVGRKAIEQRRASSKEVVIANMRRAQEAVRVLEEYSKIISEVASQEFKSVRYQLYEDEKKLLKRIL